MMTTKNNNVILEAFAESLEIPQSAYEAAEQRYRSLGEWLGSSSDSRSKQYSPHVSPQGSFRLGTVNRPLSNEDDFDLDLSCKLEKISPDSCSQANLKALLRDDLEDYRTEKRIQNELEEKRRCWRLLYKDKLSFHIDIVPATPATMEKKATLEERMINFGNSEDLSKSAVHHALSITDNEDSTFYDTPGNWHHSNPEGYALWFRSQMEKNEQLMENFAKAAAKVDELPAYKWKSPLQKCIQILKRHRDVLYANHNQDSKPISIIISTLAAKAYEGENNLTKALSKILNSMESLIASSSPKVPNPVNPKEDFADKWDTGEGKALELEKHFRHWIKEAQKDFSTLTSASSVMLLEKVAREKFHLDVKPTTVQKQSKVNGLLNKAQLINSNTAKTSIAGVIGATGVKNLAHKFYGEEA